MLMTPTPIFHGSLRLTADQLWKNPGEILPLCFPQSCPWPHTLVAEALRDLTLDQADPRIKQYRLEGMIHDLRSHRVDCILHPPLGHGLTLLLINGMPLVLALLRRLPGATFAGSLIDDLQVAMASVFPGSPGNAESALVKGGPASFAVTQWLLLCEPMQHMADEDPGFGGPMSFADFFGRGIERELEGVAASLSGLDPGPVPAGFFGPGTDWDDRIGKVANGVCAHEIRKDLRTVLTMDPTRWIDLGPRAPGLLDDLVRARDKRLVVGGDSGFCRDITGAWDLLLGHVQQCSQCLKKGGVRPDPFVVPRGEEYRFDAYTALMMQRPAPRCPGSFTPLDLSIKLAHEALARLGHPHFVLRHLDPIRMVEFWSGRSYPMNENNWSQRRYQRLRALEPGP